MNTTQNQATLDLAERSHRADNIWLRPTSRWGHEYSFEYHKSTWRYTGLPDDTLPPCQGMDRFTFDIWHTHDGLTTGAKAGRTTDMGHASYAIDASDLLAQAISSPPRKRYGRSTVTKPDFDAVRAYEAILEAARALFPNQLCTGGYYKTIVSGAIDAFGWDMLLIAAADSARMEKVFDSFFRRTLFYMQPGRRRGRVVIQHDDLSGRGVHAPRHLQ
jgi:hypothetical protein